MRITFRKSGKEWFLILLFYMMVFQNPLASVIPIMKYIDEAVALIGVAFLAYRVLRTGKMRIPKANVGILLALLVFLCAGFIYFGVALLHRFPLGSLLECGWMVAFLPIASDLLCYLQA